MGVLTTVLGNRGKLNNTLYADASVSSLASQDGSQWRPMRLLGDAIGTITTATTPAERRANNNIIEIAPGSSFDEDLVIDMAAKGMMLMSPGAWTLGLYEGTSWNQSGTRRNIRLVGDTTRIDTINSVFGITTMNTSNRQGQQGREWMGARISGQLLQESNGGNMEVHLEAEFLGNTGDSTGVSINDDAGNANLTLWSFEQCRLRGDLNLANGQIKIHRSRFEDIIQTGGGYHILRYADIRGNFQSSLFFSGERPTGIFDSEIKGDLIAITPGDEFEMDSTTVDRFVREGGSLLNGALIDFQFSGDTLLFAGGGNPTSGQFYEQFGTALGGVAGVFNESRRQRTASTRFLTELVFQTTTGSIGTQFEVTAGGVTQTVTMNSGPAGSVALDQSRVMSNTDVSVAWNGVGDPPGPSTVQVVGR